MQQAFAAAYPTGSAGKRLHTSRACSKLAQIAAPLSATARTSRDADNWYARGAVDVDQSSGR
jgi:hypothetical protein